MVQQNHNSLCKSPKNYNCVIISLWCSSALLIKNVFFTKIEFLTELLCCCVDSHLLEYSRKKMSALSPDIQLMRFKFFTRRSAKILRRRAFQASLITQRSLTDTAQDISNTLYLQNYRHWSVTPEPLSD